MVSFDGVSLFTNVPLNDTIDIVANFIYSDNQTSHPQIQKNAFIKLLKDATQGMFLYNNKLYQQIDGVAMGSPLGPTLASFFLANMENKIFKTLHDFYPKLYLRYIDDIFVVFEDESSCTSFLNLLNAQHKNVKFTVEHSSNTLSFLDVEIKINDQGVGTWIWRKPTNTGLLLNFKALCPQKWKSGLVFGLLNRAKMICSTVGFFDKIAKKFHSQDGSSDDSDKHDNDLKVFVRIAYLDSDSKQFLKSLSALIKGKFNADIIPLYQSFKVSRYFQLKSLPLRLSVPILFMNINVHVMRA